MTKLVLPPIPTVILEIESELAKDEPNTEVLANLIRKDVSSYTMLLSTANSPWLGLAQPVASVEQAIGVLGLNKLVQMFLSVMVRDSFKGSTLLESFWTTAIEVATITDQLAQRFTGVSSDNAYMVGMLHNVGIAVMLNNFESYKAFLDVHWRQADDRICILERETFQTDHFLQSARLAVEWRLPEEVSLAARLQPIAPAIFERRKSVKEPAGSLLALVTLAKSISSEYRQYWDMDSENDVLLKNIKLALDFMNLTQYEFNEAKEDLIEDFDIDF